MQPCLHPRRSKSPKILKRQRLLRRMLKTPLKQAKRLRRTRRTALKTVELIMILSVSTIPTIPITNPGPLALSALWMFITAKWEQVSVSPGHFINNAAFCFIFLTRKIRIFERGSLILSDKSNMIIGNNIQYIDD